MPSSPAQIAANRRNSQLSTGPKSSEGKERSRRNALKHGLTGEGVALPDEDAAEVASRFQALEAELQPTGVSSRLLLRRFAYLSVRLERCERLDTAIYSKRIRHADEEYLDQRLSTIEQIASKLASDPMTVSRRLQTSPEGIDFLIGQWAELRDDLMNRQREVWSLNHWSRMERLLGIPEAHYRVTRLSALTQALAGFFENINPSEIAELNDFERVEWARSELAKVIDREVARLHEVKASLHPEWIDQDRREAASRSLFDLQHGMNQVRKYEAATERSMYKALKEFRELESTLKANGQLDEGIDNEEELGSFEPEEGSNDVLVQTVVRTHPPTPQIPETIQFSGLRSLDNPEEGPETNESRLC